MRLGFASLQLLGVLTIKNLRVKAHYRFRLLCEAAVTLVAILLALAIGRASLLIPTSNNNFGEESRLGDAVGQVERLLVSPSDERAAELGSDVARLWHHYAAAAPMRIELFSSNAEIDRFVANDSCNFAKI